MPNVPRDNRPEPDSGAASGDAAGAGAKPAEGAPCAGDENPFAAQLRQTLANLAGTWAAGSGNAAGAAVEAMGEVAGKARFDPTRVFDAQMKLWQDHQRLWMDTTARLLGQAEAGASPVIEPSPEDRRFSDREWDENPVFAYIKQAYLLNAAWAERMVASVEGVDRDTARKLDFFSRQIVDAMAPVNFGLTNPTVIRATTESRGENLRRGYDNLARVLARGKGPLAVEQVDTGAFEVGGNVAVTPGEVVFRNELLELIQYAPATETVYQRPLLIVPPWINKYYILDLRPKSSFVEWCVEQGHTVFMISWVNPDDRHRDRSFDDYLGDGLFAALDAVGQATGEARVNAIGYCIGGTLLAMGLAWLGARGDDRIAAATFFAAQVDFEEGGELRVFTDPATLSLIEDDVKRKGFLDGAQMAAAFNLLRSSDLVWHYVITNYLLGKTPPAFDLLYWNADSTRFPAQLLFDYLRDMYQENRLSTPGGLEVLGEAIDLANVKIPVFLQASRQDHIAPARSVFKAMNLFQGPRRFVLAGSGHIAGVVNPPEKNRYRHWTNARRRRYASFDAWLADAEEHPGSWWPEWARWMARKSGRKVPARVPGDGALAPLEPAPGSYVKVRWES